ncbi:MAG: hypothetical protein H6931_17655 [Burkholderiaceae bacterium]|nr:hypothetical protein [Zoogloeaceae bacterium]MCP5290917.1 hypothetical protein [Burkholderiaceae bacterium]
MSTTHSERYWYRVAWNPPPMTWRERLGARLRQWAQRLDGFSSVAIDIRTSHPIVTASALRDSFRTLDRNVCAEVRASAQESLFRRLHPELLDDA